MLTCPQVTELVTDYLEGELSIWDRMRFQLHLGMCKHCRGYVRQMRLTVRRLGAPRDEPIPPDVEAELLRRFRSWKS